MRGSSSSSRSVIGRHIDLATGAHFQEEARQVVGLLFVKFLRFSERIAVLLESTPDLIVDFSRLWLWDAERKPRRTALILPHILARQSCQKGPLATHTFLGAMQCSYFDVAGVIMDRVTDLVSQPVIDAWDLQNHMGMLHNLSAFHPEF